MNYTIIFEGKVAYTDWFESENNYVKGMIVINNYRHSYTTDGIVWADIECDHL